MDRIFELLMEILLDMISGCLEDQSRDRVRQRLISRDRIVKRRLNRAVKRAAIELGGREWWRLNRDTLEAQALDEYERMAASDIDALIEEASEEA